MSLYEKAVVYFQSWLHECCFHRFQWLTSQFEVGPPHIRAVFPIWSDVERMYGQREDIYMYIFRHEVRIWDAAICPRSGCVYTAGADGRLQVSLNGRIVPRHAKIDFPFNCWRVAMTLVRKLKTDPVSQVVFWFRSFRSMKVVGSRLKAYFVSVLEFIGVYAPFPLPPLTLILTFLFLPLLPSVSVMLL